MDVVTGASVVALAGASVTVGSSVAFAAGVPVVLRCGVVVVMGGVVGTRHEQVEQPSAPIVYSATAPSLQRHVRTMQGVPVVRVAVVVAGAAVDEAAVVSGLDGPVVMDLHEHDQHPLRSTKYSTTVPSLQRHVRDTQVVVVVGRVVVVVGILHEQLGQPFSSVLYSTIVPSLQLHERGVHVPVPVYVTCSGVVLRPTVEVCAPVVRPVVDVAGVVISSLHEQVWQPCSSL